ncbi:MAG: 23S rRNA (guanosine(2251)-2'-O)-methyltransferase RlmB [Actinobacteria bacterium]|nr:23S rRNA (guanosine(2251)-2'-O)-methyltransferase RlmB [Actinomycetota bacterium]
MAQGRRSISRGAERRRPRPSGRKRPEAERAPGRGGRPAAVGAPAPVAADRLVYGVNPVREALFGLRAVGTVWVLVSVAARGMEREVREWARAAGVVEPRIMSATAEELMALSGTSDHQGMVAEVAPYRFHPKDELLAAHDLLLALDRIQDPHNLGASIRCAEVAGAGIVIPRHRAASVTPAVVKASAGATEHAALAQVRNLSDFLNEARRSGFWVFGAAMDAPPYYQQDFTARTVFVLGSEGEGLGRRVASVCDALVGIPQVGRINSLNVSVSAGILLFEAVRQRAVGRQTEIGRNEGGSVGGSL